MCIIISHYISETKKKYIIDNLFQWRSIQEHIIDIVMIQILVMEIKLALISNIHKHGKLAK